MLAEVAESIGQAAQTDREFRFSKADFYEIATILREEAGITLQESKAPLVYARLVKRLRSLGLADFSAYVGLLKGPDSVQERLHLVTALTTNVTRFFRESHHFDHLRSAVVAPIVAGRNRSNRIRLWSAACSTGQEPYSIAAAIIDLVNDASIDIKILATDIDPTVIAHAKAGRYDSIDGVPTELQRYFQKSGSGWEIDAALRTLVTFRQLNLNASWPIRGPFDGVFCRNVVIYFDQNTQNRLWSSLARVIRPGGILYIGHSERIAGEAAAFFETIGTTTYQRRSNAQ